MVARRSVIQCILFSALAASLVASSNAQPMLFDPAPPAGGAQPSTPAATIAPQAPAPPTLADKRAQNSDQLRIAMRKLEVNGATDTTTVQDVAYFQTREAVLTQQDTVERQIKDLESRKGDLENLISTPRVDSKQYKFADLDQMKDELAAEQARSSFASDKLANAKASLQLAQVAAEDCESKRQKAQAAYDGGKDAPNASVLAADAEHARQDATLATEALALRKREVDRETLAQEVLNLLIRMRQDKVARVSPLVAFTDADLKEQIESIKKSMATASATRLRAQTDLNDAEIKFETAKQQLAAANDETRPVLTESLIARRMAREKLSEDIESLTQRSLRYQQTELAWQRRYQVATTDPANTDHEVYAQLKKSQSETKKVLENLTRDLRTQIGKMKDVRSSLTSVAKKLEAAAKGPEDLAVQLNSQQGTLEEQLKIYEKNLVTIETTRRVHEKLAEEISPLVEALTPQAIAMGLWYRAASIWDSKPFGSIGGQPVKVGDAVKGLTILIIGWMFSRSTSGMFANRFLKRFRLSKDATSAIRSLVFYSLLMFVALSALNTVGVPLTAFTILGGGLAIGLGFGSQTLINNFIGGLIMLAERPVRLGERITFSGIDGVVEDVGFRCTKLRTQADHLVTIPNSTLINESIENIDRRRTIRRAFTVAVTYNLTHEQLEDAVQAIRDILEEKDIRERIHPIVGFEELSPQVHFSDFAAESLNIQVTYWYAPIDNAAFADHTERVNFRIMEEFDRLGVQFAFPSKTAYVTKQSRPGRGRGDSYAA